MRRIRLSLSLASALLLASGCGPSNTPTPDPTPQRVLVVDSDGKVIHQSTGDDQSRVTFPAQMDRVWRALVASYADAGIDPTISDRATGRYGNAAFAVPRRMIGRPIGQVFDCGSNLTGALVDAGHVTAVVITTLSSLPDSTTSASTRVTGSLRRSDGSSSAPILCTSTGAIEEYLRIATLKRLAMAP
ncbi:MAG TPA: hypothetical protein VIJ90_10705 [Gemmatimonadaceae bacterium]